MLTSKRQFPNSAVFQGETVNFKKLFSIFSPNVSDAEKEQFKIALQVNDREDLGTYLGIPLDMNEKSSQKLLFLKGRVVQKITGWKYNHLSLAGKVILWNSILASLASHLFRQVQNESFYEELQYTTKLLLGLV